MLRRLIAGSMVLLGSVFFLDGGLGVQGAGEKEITIKLVMQKAMKGGLCGKVAKGEASEEEKKQLIEYFTGLTKTTPPKGDEKAWKEKTKALLDAAKGTDAAALKKAANCQACHDVFREKK
jgi:surface antigen